VTSLFCKIRFISDGIQQSFAKCCLANHIFQAPAVFLSHSVSKTAICVFVNPVFVHTKRTDGFHTKRYTFAAERPIIMSETSFLPI
jgi:hypothetical protein